MKVILAGMPKTGTKSMAQALKILGYEVYDFMEHFQYHRKDWERILTVGGSVDDFRRMYENVDAVTDVPACCFWDEIYEAFPESKIVLTMKESEDAFIDAFMAQHLQLNAMPLKLMPIISPTAKKMDQFLSYIAIGLFSCVPIHTWFATPHINILQLRRTYRRHNANVMQNAPKEKLLVYSLKEGWGPLCKFLDKEIPNTPFPHKNKRGTKVVDLLKGDPTMRRVFQEAAVALAVVACLTSFVVYKVYTADSLSQMLSDSVSSVERVVLHLWKTITNFL